MKLELNIPDPKVNKGEVWEKRGEDYTEGSRIICHIHRVGPFSFNGRVRANENDEWKAELTTNDYNERLDGEVVVVVQKGSTTTVGTLIRPGTVLVYSLEVFERCGNKIEWDGEIVSADTEQNLRERHEAWKKEQGE
jgi:hypothetical protein